MIDGFHPPVRAGEFVFVLVLKDNSINQLIIDRFFRYFEILRTPWLSWDEDPMLVSKRPRQNNISD